MLNYLICTLLCVCMYMTKRCVSGCRGLDSDICEKAPRCSYASGEKRRFCRLHKTYKMNKSDCKVRNKTVKNNHATVIHKFMKNTTFKRRAEFLKSRCFDSGACYTFGILRKKIFDFFDGFTGFEYVMPPIHAIGNPSANGFVKSIQYERKGYVANAVLKSSTKASADNLAYEFVVGCYLNKVGKRFPCFVDTYGLYYYKDEDLWNHAKNTKVMQTNILKDSLKIYKHIGNYNDEVATVINEGVCEGSKYSAILIQHLKNVYSIGDVFKNGSKSAIKYFVLTDLLHVLYQVYMPLAMMVDTFTHYDLHHNNVMLYEPMPGTYIHYHYHIDGEIVSFKSNYMAKIIDYGRAFYKDPDNKKNTSTSVLNEVCKVNDCNEKPEICGDKSGFRYLTNDSVPSTYYMSSSIKNPSSDLRLIHILAYNHNVGGTTFSSKDYGLKDEDISDIFEPIMDMMENTNYGIGIDPNETKYGTRPLPHAGYPSRINNVRDAEKFMRNAILSNKAMHDYNELTYENVNKLGDLHIYSDGRNMKFKRPK